MAPSKEVHQKVSFIDRMTTVSVAIMLVALLYRFFIYDTVMEVIGVSRPIQSLEEFPYDCKRLSHPLLEACEDIWLDEEGRKLYAACSTIGSRQGWNPGASLHNASTRAGTDHISVIDIDKPGSDGLYGVRQLELASGSEQELDLHGFDVRRVGDDLRFWLINHRPPTDVKSGELIDSASYGANSTIEIFDLKKASQKLEHVRTIHHDAIITPNNLVVEEDGVGFFLTNDHDAKLGLRHSMILLLGGGSISHCQSDTGECQVVAKSGFAFPNGIVRGNDGLYYVAHALKGIISVHRWEEGKFTKVGTIYTRYPMDNLMVDAEGNIIAAAFPKTLASIRVIQNPYNPDISAPVLALKIQKVEPEDEGGKPEYLVTKLIEDEGKILPVSTSAVHDVKTGQIFMTGITSSFIAVCEKRP